MVCYGVAKTHTIPITVLPFGQTPRCFTNPWGTRGKPYLPFDIAEATYLLPPLDLPTSTETLIAYRATQLLKHPEDLCDMATHILRARKISATQFAEHFASTIRDHDFAIGSLV